MRELKESREGAFLFRRNEQRQNKDKARESLGARTKSHQAKSHMRFCPISFKFLGDILSGVVVSLEFYHSEFSFVTFFAVSVPIDHMHIMALLVPRSLFASRMALHASLPNGHSTCSGQFGR